MKTVSTEMNNLSVGVIIQARMGSSRLPGKILMRLPFNGSKDSLSWIIHELKTSSILKHIILATSTAPENQILSTLAARYGIGYYQGSENNVLSRFADVIRLYGLNVVVRITGDNPIIDVGLIEEVVKSHIKDQQDYSYTVNLPLGMNIEVFSAEAFLSFKDEELDDSDRESISKAYREIHNTFGKIDVIINNAYYSKGQSPETMSDEDWNYGIDGVLSSVFKSITEIIPYYKDQGYGKIINVSSMYGIIAPDFKIYNHSPEYLNPPHYGAAKAGVLQLTRYYASYLGKLNIQVNSVTPGPFPSKAVQENKSFITKLKQHTALSRVGNPEDLAGVFTFLSSEAANFITGQNFIIDGGWTTK